MSDSSDDENDIYKAMTFGQLMTELLKKVSTVPTDLRQDRYCRYMNSFLSLYGDERCKLVGSTKEGTRLRSNQDQGDYDYLIISEILISTKCLKYNDEFPCFVRIDGTELHDELPVELVDGIYLPSNLLRTVSSEAFTGLRGLYSFVSLVSTVQGQHIPIVTIDKSNKPGVTLTNFTDWMCDELPVRSRSPNIDSEKVHGLFRERIRNSPFLMHVSTKVIHVLRKMVLLAKTLSDDFRIGTQLSQYLDPLVNAVTDIINSPTTSSNHISPSTLNTTNLDENYGSIENTEDDEVFYASYRLKSQKRFIAALPLDGQPKHMKTWKERTCDKAWPGVDVANNICKSDFFVVSKPLVKDASDNTEFCLSYISAETQLSSAMYPVQRKSLLVIKAFQESALADYTDKLTTFHWKTALYWVSELSNLSQISDDSDDNVLSFVSNVVSFMLTSLRKSNLQHYFNPTNIVAHLDVTTISKIVELLNEVLNDPVEALREYFRYVDINSSVRTIELSRSEMQQMQKYLHTDMDQFVIDTIVSTLEQFVREPPQSSDDEPLFKKAVMKVAAVFCSDLTKDLVEKGRPLLVPVDRIMKTFDTYLTAPESKTQDAMFALFTVFKLSGLLKELAYDK